MNVHDGFIVSLDAVGEGGVHHSCNGLVKSSEGRADPLVVFWGGLNLGVSCARESTWAQ